ncbi:sulfatase [Halococcus hamelinensis 100A6]|uniref:Sulfatase n=1 Tax=Halococcus hamelinensis 100A6 TaxID=1132509 RepID=M0LXV2_9EURY|nr:sulfatase [Halococcus hamelinensis 100A6]
MSRYLREYDGDTPFFATASFNLPHPPYFEDECFQQYYDREEVSLPTNFNDDLSTKPAFHRERAKAEECDLSEDEYREVAYRYRTMVSRVDAYIGVVLDTLRSEGLYDDTVIVFTADHGDMQAAHGLNKKGVLAYEEILRVPLVVHHPQLDIERNVIPDFVSTAAVPGTIVEAAGESVSQAFTGGSLLPTMERSSPPDDDRVFFEHNVAYWGHHPYRGVRTPDWKLVEYPKDGEGELYDMQTDADELTNRYNDPDYITVREALENTIERWWNATDGDMDDWITEPDLSFSP